VVAAAHDQVGSAATVGADAARAVGDLLTTVVGITPEAFPAAILDAVDLLVANQQAMAPVMNLRNAVYLHAAEGPEAVAAAVADLERRIRDSWRGIAEVGVALIPSGGTVLIHSASSTVRTVLEVARDSTDFDVVCTRAMPIGEGIAMAAELREAGFDVELIDDDTAIEVLPGMDVILAGADAIGPAQVINKVGTAVLAGAAKAIGVSFYLVAATEKILPEVLFNAALQRRGREDLSEAIALDVFSGVVTEIGVLDAAAVAAYAGSLAVAEGLAT
jgi:translation initiation factor 2B subunit (eIF-2B alpha/beta/delta family)